jgi:septum formation inhibitor MinC
MKTSPTGMSQKASLEERLKSHPALKAKIEALLSVVENAEGEVILADEAEQQVIEEIRQLGQAALQGWASRQQQRQSEAFAQAHPTAQRSGKKSSTGTVDTAASK